MKWLLLLVMLVAVFFGAAYLAPKMAKEPPPVKNMLSEEKQNEIKEAALQYCTKHFRNDRAFEFHSMVYISQKWFLKDKNTEYECYQMDELIRSTPDTPNNIIMVRTWPTYYNEFLKRKDSAMLFVEVYMDSSLNIIDFNCDKGIFKVPIAKHTPTMSPRDKELYELLLENERNKY